MNIHLALLLTRDAGFEKIVTEALEGIGAKALVKHDIDHALEIGCKRVSAFDVVLIDRSDCHAITLLTALHACRPDLPVVVITSGDPDHCAALAYANGAAACLAKPITVPDLKLALHELFEPIFKLESVS